MTARVAALPRPAAWRAAGASVWPVLVLIDAWLVTLLFRPWDDESITDLGLFNFFADRFVDGSLPYSGVDFEYPPLAAPVLALPGAAGGGYDTYRIAFAVLMLGAAMALLFAVRRLATLTGGSPVLAAAGVALSPLLLGATIRNHFDLVPVAIAALALLLIVRGRTSLGFAALGIGAMTKAFPLAIAPVALAWLWGRGERQACAHAVAALAVALAVPALAAVALSPSGAADSVAYQMERPVQVESVPATVLLTGDSLGAMDVSSVESHKSNGLEHPAAGTLAALWSLAGLAAVALLALAAARRPGSRELVLAGLAAVCAFAAFGKVLSPQFAVWIVPLMALALAWRLWPLAASAAGAIVLTFVEFPARYWDLVARDPFPVVTIATRNALLLMCVWLAWRELRLTPPAAAPARSP